MSLINVQKLSNGALISGGKLYIGTYLSNEPEVNPVTVYTDAALTQGIDISTGADLDQDGFPLVKGVRTTLYSATDYSLQIRDRVGAPIFTQARQFIAVANSDSIAKVWDVLGVPPNSDDMGDYTGNILTDKQSAKENIQEVSNASEANAALINDNSIAISSNASAISNNTASVSNNASAISNNALAINSNAEAVNRSIRRPLDELLADTTIPVDTNNAYESSEYVTGSGVGGGKYQKVSVNPGNNLINPATTDGNWLKNINNGAISPYAAGAAADGVANDLASLQQIYSQTGVLILDTSLVYNCGDGSLTLTSPTLIKGNRSELRNITIGTSGVVGGIIIDRVKFDTDTVSGTNAPICILLENANTVNITRCEFNNVRTFIRGNDGSIHYYAHIRDCQFTANFTNFDYTSAQQDILTINGYRDVIIDANRFDATNTTRFMKLSAGTEVSAVDPNPITNIKGMFVTNNDFNGVGAGSKQVADCFNGSVQFVFDGNNVKTRGYSSGFENKTGFSYSETGVMTSYKFVNNFFDMDAPSINIQGAYGATEWVQNSYDNVNISDNSFIVTDEASGAVAVRFMNSVIVKGNEFTANTDIADKVHIDVSSSELVVISLNTLNKGIIDVAVNTTNSGGFAFDSEVQHLTINGNIINEFLGRAGIMPRNLGEAKTITISGNSVATITEGGSFQSAYWIRSCTAEFATVTGNSGYTPTTPVKADLDTAFSTITKLVNTANSWS